MEEEARDSSSARIEREEKRRDLLQVLKYPNETTTPSNELL